MGWIFYIEASASSFGLEKCLDFLRYRILTLIGIAEGMQWSSLIIRIDHTQ